MLKEVYQSYKFIKGLKKLDSLDQTEKEKSENLLANIIDQQGGMFTKIAQLLDLNNKKKVKESTFDKTSVLSTSAFIAECKKEWGHEIYTENIETILDNSNCASIGQVQKAKLLSGQNIAIKLQYPGVEKNLKEQLKVFSLALKAGKISALKKWDIDFNSYQKMLTNLISRELNFYNEQSKIIKIRKLIGKDKYLKIPHVYEKLSSKKTLSLDYFEGELIFNCESWPVKRKEKMAYNLVYSFLLLLLNGVIQADSNPGNFIFMKENGEEVLGLIDFGQVLFLDDKVIKNSQKLFKSIDDGIRIDAYSVFSGFNFNMTKLMYIEDQLDSLLKVLLKPFFLDREVSLRDLKIKEEVNELLGESKWWFRSAGGDEFFLLLKSYAGFSQLINQLNVKINYRKILKDVLDTYPKEIIVDVPIVKNDLKPRVEKLYVKVVKDCIEIVNLEFPFNAALNIEDLIDEDIKAAFIENSISVEQVRDKVRSYKGGEEKLFEAMIGNRKILVYLK